MMSKVAGGSPTNACILVLVSFIHFMIEFLRTPFEISAL